MQALTDGVARASLTAFEPMGDSQCCRIRPGMRGPISNCVDLTHSGIQHTPPAWNMIAPGGVGLGERAVGSLAVTSNRRVKGRPGAAAKTTSLVGSTMGRRLHSKANLLGQATLDIDFQAMSLDELWALYEQILPLLTAKLETDKGEIEQRLDRLKCTREILKRGVVAAGLAKALSSSPLFASTDVAEGVLTMLTLVF